MLSDINNYKQNLTTDKEKKNLYGEIFTPFSLIKKIFDLIPEEAFSDRNKKWLDPGSGTGYFSIFLFCKLNNGLKTLIADDEERKAHIIKNMIYMVELQEDNINHLQNIFGKKANIIRGDYREIEFKILSFDYIIGNPPYNFQGLKKVPTNGKKKKKEDGQTIWIDFIKRSISLLKSKGNLLMIVPSIWMKPDKAKTYDYLTSFKINKIRSLSNSETNKIFSGEAQTPTCYFHLIKEKGNNNIELYDKCREKYINYNFQIGYPIPVFGISIINNLQPLIKNFGHLQVIKTNLPPKDTLLLNTLDSIYKYKNIHTAILNNLDPELVIKYSKNKLAYSGIPKLILPHKMYGFPYLDVEGIYGISNRDNYVIINRSITDLQKIRSFLSTKTALYLFEATRYRMKYLEKYIFQLIPDITKINDFPEIINDETIANYFNFDDIDRENIQNLHKKQYSFSYKI